MYIRSMMECDYSEYKRPDSNAPHEFENLVRDCAAIALGQNFHLYGRSGQAQYGIDIFSDDWTILIQCKAYSETKENYKKFQADIEDEFYKAKAHFQRAGKPFFRRFILATTLRGDAPAQDIAEKLNEQEPDIKISVWFRDKLQKIIKDCSIHNDGDSYAKGFEETLFLHKNQLGCENVCLKNLFVYQEYREWSIGNDFGKTQDGLEERIKRFCSDEKDKMLIIEGDAGTGKSTLAAMLCFEERRHSRQIVEPLPEAGGPLSPSPGLLAGRPLLTVRLRDMKTSGNPENDLGTLILSHLNIPEKEELKRLFPRAVFLLDGFDELYVKLKNEFSYKVIECESMLTQLCGWLPKDCKLILTSRPKCIHVDQLSTAFPFSMISLAHFSSRKRDKWLDRYCTLCPVDRREVDKKVAQYIRSIRKNSASNLCDTPMTLYLLVGGKVDIELTKNAWALYRYIFNDIVVNTPYSGQLAEAPHPVGTMKGRLIYWITEEIAYKMYCAGEAPEDQSTIRTEDGQFLVTGKTVEKIISNLFDDEQFCKDAKQAGLKKDDGFDLQRIHALCCYWRSSPADGPVEFYHNSIRDFFLCEKIRRVFNGLYQEKGLDEEKDEEKTKRMAERLVSLFKFGEINETVCDFLREYARDAVSNGQQNEKEFPLREKKQPLLPVLYQKLLTDGTLYDGLKMKDHAGAIKNILQSTALVYHSVYEPILNEGEKIRWWNDVAAVNHSDVMNYIFCQLVMKIGYRSDLRKVDMHRADLHGADLREADLSGSDLNRTDLHGAKMDGVLLRGANLFRADLTRTALVGADLNEANLGKAELNRANLSNADLRNAEFRGADLRGTTLPDGFRSDDQKTQIGRLKSLNIFGLKIQREGGTANGTHSPLSSRAAGRRAAADFARGQRAGTGLRRR